MKYIKAEEVFLEVENELDTYFEGNYSGIDRSILYPRLKYCLSKLRLNSFPEKKVIVEVSNNKAELPSDFYQLCLALGCISDERVKCDRYDETIHTAEQVVCNIGKCDSWCNYEKDCDGSYYRIIQKERGPNLYSFKRQHILSPSKEAMSLCHNSCPNMRSNSPNVIDIRNGIINTNFSDGVIYLEYLSTLELDDDYLIPDNKTFIEWVKSEFVYSVFKKLYYTTEGDWKQRKDDSNRERGILEAKALSIIKTPERNEITNLSNILIKRYNRLRTWDERFYNSRVNNRNNINGI